MRRKGFWLVVLVALCVAIFLSPLASPNPDGLERVAEDEGFLTRAYVAVQTLFPDYQVPALGESPLSGSLAGAIGVVLTALAGLVLGKAFARRRAVESNRGDVQ